MPPKRPTVDVEFEDETGPSSPPRDADVVPCACMACDGVFVSRRDRMCARCRRVCLPALREAHRRMDGGAPIAQQPAAPPPPQPTGPRTMLDDVRTIAGFARQAHGLFDELLGGGASPPARPGPSASRAPRTGAGRKRR